MLAYDNGSLEVSRVTSISYSYTDVIEYINGKLGVTLTDQPLYIRNSTYTGWIKNPDEIKIGWYMYNPVNNTWIMVQNISYKVGVFKVYDIVTSKSNTFIVDNSLTDVKT